MSYKSDSKITNTNTHNEGGSSKHSSNAGEREMRKEATRTPEQARAKHQAVDTKDHPALKGNTTKG
jgi:hypothetical protein